MHQRQCVRPIEQEGLTVWRPVRYRAMLGVKLKTRAILEMQDRIALGGAIEDRIAIWRPRELAAITACQLARLALRGTQHQRELALSTGLARWHNCIEQSWMIVGWLREHTVQASRQRVT